MNLFYKMKKGTEELNYGRSIVTEYVKRYIYKTNKEKIEILDLGAGRGTDLSNINGAVCGGVNIGLNAIEYYKPNVISLQELGINVFSIDIEKDKLPFDDGTIDIVIMNQVLEHTKEIFWIFGEISRVLKSEGECVVGVPNLASLHNRVMLLSGNQPTSIRLLGPHVANGEPKRSVRRSRTAAMRSRAVGIFN